MANRKAKRSAYEVFLDAADLGATARVGILYRHGERTDLPASFEYNEQWVKSNQVFRLDPRLELWRGEQRPVAGAPAFGVFMDSSPDRWGRMLMERREAADARRAGRPVRGLQEMDFLLGVHDLTRSGALRFRSVDGGPYLDDSDAAIPPITSLQELARISQQLEDPGVEDLPLYTQWLTLLIAPGTSLGGARPKANFTDAGRLWIAKFPSHADRHDVGAWEYLTHRLAKRAGLCVPESCLEKLTDRYSTFCVARFDRVGEGRRMFASAMTLLGHCDGGGTASYLDLAEFISDRGSSGHVAEDLSQLFRRVVFNVIVGNRDDHLRNHGFIREATGWRLAPAYDMNPNPYKAEHVLTLDGRVAAPLLSAAVETGGFYRLSELDAQTIVAEVRDAVSSWRDEAEQLRLPGSEIARMESVFQV